MGVRKKGTPDGGGPGEVVTGRMRPAQCETHLREELAAAFPEIVQGFVKAAKKGSCAHVKLTTELLQRPAQAAPRGKSSARLMVEGLERLELLGSERR